MDWGLFMKAEVETTSLKEIGMFGKITVDAPITLDLKIKSNDLHALKRENAETLGGIVIGGSSRI
jgi:hypothetical protein